MIPGLSPALGAISQLTTAAAELQSGPADESVSEERTVERLELAKVMIDDAIEEMEGDEE
jgi:hypothetical protein